MELPVTVDAVPIEVVEMQSDVVAATAGEADVAEFEADTFDTFCEFGSHGGPGRRGEAR
jgi:hypothetical protein